MNSSQRQQEDNKAIEAAVSALAAASDSPFKTGFKVMMGIMLAKTLAGLINLGIFALIVGGTILLVKAI